MFARVVTRGLGTAAPLACATTIFNERRGFPQAAHCQCQRGATAHPLDDLTAEEIRTAAAAARTAARAQCVGSPRFNTVTLAEPPKVALTAFYAGKAPAPRRVANVTLVVPSTGRTCELEVALPEAKVLKFETAAVGQQPPFTPDDCFLAEEIVKADAGVVGLLKSRYNITDLALLACDPWSVHVADPDFAPLKPDENGVVPRLVQTFLYMRQDADDNHYAHPIDLLPVVDLNTRKVVSIDGAARAPPKIPSASVNYHRNKVSSNTYLANEFRTDIPAPLEVVQPQGPSFRVDGQEVTWQKWSMRVGFNSREGLVLHDVRFDGRPVLNRASLVEMAVPYGDTHAPFERKCAFDIGDYGLGYCTNSLELGCDCLGHIHYFDGTLSDSIGEPYTVKKAVCMHEEDHGILWKHVEYRNGHSEARRSRRLVLSFICTVVNYEYLFYWYFSQDGTIEFEIRLSGMLSTNLLSEGETSPTHGTLAAPGVNAQVHQHMFSARLDMAVDGLRNTVSEVNIAPEPAGKANPYNNGFGATETVLKRESDAKREANPATARTWNISNPESINPVTKKPVAYKLVPASIGASMPLLLTGPDCMVTKRGQFATKSLWVTPHRDDERFPAGDYTVQSAGGDGLPRWTAANRSVENTDVVLWHSFGLAHVPRPEDFPVMPCEMTGFALKPDGFFSGNPTVDLPATVSSGSKCCSHSN